MYSKSFTDPLIFLTCFRTSFWFPSKLEDDGDADRMRWKTNPNINNNMKLH